MKQFGSPDVGYATFIPGKNEILLPKGVTKMGLYHEYEHAAHFIELGKNLSAYKNVGRFGREQRVLEKLMERNEKHLLEKGKPLFNSREIDAAQKYVRGIWERGEF
jgi:hypothetical protein